MLPTEFHKPISSEAWHCSGSIPRFIEHIRPRLQQKKIHHFAKNEALDAISLSVNRGQCLVTSVTYQLGIAIRQLRNRHQPNHMNEPQNVNQVKSSEVD